jgi:transketolase
VPAFDGDVTILVDRLMRSDSPAYLRLGASEQPKALALPSYAPWRRLLTGHGATLVVVGPLVGGIVNAAQLLDELHRPTIWLLSELPFPDCPSELIDDIQRSGHLAVVEEHVAQGGAGQMLARHLLLQGTAPRNFTHCAARGYVSGRYGSQQFHRIESGLDPTSVLAQIGARKIA